MNILFCENEEFGGAHARSNASLVVALRRRFPDATVYVHVAARHYEIMQASVEADLRSFFDEVRFIELTPPAASRSRLPGRLGTLSAVVRHYVRTAQLLRNAIRLCQQHHCDFMLFGSGQGFHIRLVKWIGKLRRLESPVLFVVHNWRDRKRSLLYESFFPTSFAAAETASSVRCYYIFLHGGMRRYLEKLHDTTLGDQFVDFPYPVVYGSESANRRGTPGHITVDFLSPSFKGVEMFCQYVAACREKLEQKQLQDRISFGVIGGFTPGSADRVATALKEVGVTRFPDRSLTEHEYRAALLDATYLIHWYDPRHYECRFSSAVQDGIAWRLPAIFLANNYSKHLFEDVGEPGWQVDSLEEAVDLTVRLVETFDPDAYRRQVDAVDQVRQYLSLEKAGDRYQSIIDQMGVHTPTVTDVSAAAS